MKKLIREPCLWMAMVFFMMIAIQVFLPPGAQACNELKGWSGINWGTKIEDIETEMVSRKQTSHEVNGKTVKLNTYHMAGKKYPKYIVGQPQFLFIDGQFALVFMAVNSRKFIDGMLEEFEGRCGKPNVIQKEKIIWESKKSTIYVSTIPNKLGVVAASTSGYAIFVAIMINIRAEGPMEDI